eukprot:6469622-Amphidinium_carterae.2
MAKQRHGPLRAEGSIVKIRCGLKRCRSKRDVKNIAKSLQVPADSAALQPALCRSIRSHTKVVKFCCRAHMEKATRGQQAAQRGQREVLDISQLQFLFHKLVQHNFCWTAVLPLTMSLLLAERADCARRVTLEWLQNIDADGREALIAVPRCNGKTKARVVPLPCWFAQQLHKWLYKAPLRGPSSQWPFPNQDLQKKTAPLFPGAVPGKGTDRQWKHPVSERGYLKVLKTVAATIGKERAATRSKDPQHKHIMDEVSLSMIGTHTFKRSGVTIMKDFAKCGS